MMLLLNHGVDFSSMSAYYLAAVMLIYPEGPLEMAQEDTVMLKRLIDAGARVDSFLAVNAWVKDTPFMYAAHMGLLEPLKIVLEAGTNVFEAFEGQNALDRLQHPVVHDPQISDDKRLLIQALLEGLGLEPSEPREDQTSQAYEQKAEPTKEDMASLENLFGKL
jgi:hypothetical protein